MRGVLARVALVALALAGAIWCATGLRAAHLEAEALSALAGPNGSQEDFSAFLQDATPGRIRRAATLFREARDWAPHQTNLTFEAGLLNLAGDPRGAVRLMEDLVRSEPDNPDGWVALSTLLAARAPARAELARRRALELSPPVERD